MKTQNLSALSDGTPEKHKEEYSKIFREGNNKLKLLKILCDYKDQRGFMPSLAEAGKIMGRPKQRIHEYIVSLEKLGILEKEYALTRGIAFAEKGNEVKIPLCSWNSAKMAWGNIVGGKYVSKQIARSGLLIYSVIEDSFINQNILSGDCLVIQLNKDAPWKEEGLYVVWDPNIGKRLLRINEPTDNYKHLLMLGKVLKMLRYC